MTTQILEDLIYDRIECLVDQMLVHQRNGDEVSYAVLEAEVQDLLQAAESTDAADNFFYAAYHGNTTL